MKKTAGTSSSKTNVTPVRTVTKTSSSKIASTRSAASGRKRSKKNYGGVVAAIVATVAVVGAGIYFIPKLTKGKLIEEKIEIVQDDGTVVEMTPEEVRTILNDNKFYSGIHIDGIDVSGLSMEEAKNLVSQKQPEVPVEMNISLDIDGENKPLDMSSLELEWNIDEVLNQAYSYKRVPDLNALNSEQLLKQYNDVKALAGTPYECTTAYTVNTDGISEIVHSELDPLIVEKKNAELKGFNFATLEFDIDPSVEGVSIDVDKVISDVKAALDSRTYESIVPVEVVTDVPDITTESIMDGYGMIAEASSKTTTDNSRNHNIRITCEKLDGMILQPGETFSYNDSVGKRTPENGYERAGVIIDGESKEDYGGGICQLSSMIYQAVVKSNLKVEERHAHSWPSTYTDYCGTDATVDWGVYDFRFTNNSEYPVILHTFYNNDEYRVTAQIYGHLLENGMHIEFIGEQTSYTAPGEPEYVANPDMPVGQTHSVRPAHAAISARSYQVWYDADGNEVSRNEYDTSYYPMIRAKIEVGVLNEDGSIAEMNPETGEVATPETEETESSDETSSSDETLPSGETLTSDETLPTGETSNTDVPPIDTSDPNNTEIPSDTIPEETPADTEAPPPEETPADTEAPPPEETPADTEAPEEPSDEGAEA